MKGPEGCVSGWAPRHRRWPETMYAECIPCVEEQSQAEMASGAGVRAGASAEIRDAQFRAPYAWCRVWPGQHLRRAVAGPQALPQGPLELKGAHTCLKLYWLLVLSQNIWILETDQYLMFKSGRGKETELLMIWQWHHPRCHCIII